MKISNLLLLILFSINITKTAEQRLGKFTIYNYAKQTWDTFNLDTLGANATIINLKERIAPEINEQDLSKIIIGRKKMFRVPGGENIIGIEPYRDDLRINKFYDQARRQSGGRVIVNAEDNWFDARVV